MRLDLEWCTQPCRGSQLPSHKAGSTESGTDFTAYYVASAVYKGILSPCDFETIKSSDLIAVQHTWADSASD